MPIIIRIDDAAGWARVEMAGSITDADQLEVIDRLLAHPDYQVGFDILLDYRQVAAPGSTWLARAGAEQMRKHEAQLRGVRMAMIVDGEAKFGMARMFATLSESASINVRVFRDAADATEWLRSEETSTTGA